jgi:hypothetical protein
MEPRYIAERKVDKRLAEGWTKSEDAPERGGLVFMNPPKPKVPEPKPTKLRKVKKTPEPDKKD